MGDELDRQGYPGYRVADPASMRLLLRGPLPIGSLGRVLGITRQAARKVARKLRQRGHATTESDPHDARKVVVVLTEQGRAYAGAIVDVFASLNQTLAVRVNPTSWSLLTSSCAPLSPMTMSFQSWPSGSPPATNPRSVIRSPEDQRGIGISQPADRSDLRLGGGWLGVAPRVRGAVPVGH